MRILQINTVVNTGSDGRIAEEIGRMLLAGGHQSYIGYGRTAIMSSSELIKIGGTTGQAFHLIRTRIFDRHGFGSVAATKSFLKKIDEIDPDLIHLHNLHGYYLNIELLFKYLKDCNKPIVWTLHDCWPFTGHCTHFEYYKCDKWKSQCFDCPNLKGYPKAILFESSGLNYRDKKRVFTGVGNMTLVLPSAWIAKHVRDSFLSGNEIRIINNGIDLDVFVPSDNKSAKQKYGLTRRYVLGVASTWTDRKGYSDFMTLRKLLDPEIEIILIGLTKSQIRKLIPGVRGILRTEDVDDLAAIYSSAEIYVNPTYSDNFPATNIESLACGTPVAAYDTGGCKEALSDECGSTVTRGDVRELHRAIVGIMKKGKGYYTAKCRARAVEHFDKNDRFADYLKLYKALV